MANKIAGRSAWGIALCKAFGEDPSKVHCITLTSHVNAAVKVVIERYVTDDETQIIEVIKECTWEEVAE